MSRKRGRLRWLPVVAVVLCCLTPAVAQPPAEDVVPAYFQKLIDVGSVELTYHDPSKHEVGTGGKAYFNYRFEHDVKFRFRWRRAETPGKQTLTITPQITDTKVTVTHTVTVPESYQTPRVWETRLVKHEFDHVAISSDPRVLKLLEHLVRKLGPITRTIDAEEKPDRALCLKIINEECDRRREAVVELVQANYRLLDEITQHGTKRIPDRPAFFQQLFRKDHVDAQKFPYTAEVLDLLSSRNYLETQLHYKDEPNL